MSVFDGLPEVFQGVFGESVVYQAAAGGAPVTVDAIWIETSIAVNLDGVDVDGTKAEISFRVSDVPAPKEGDTVKRVKDNKIMKIVPSIMPDDKGMVVCSMVAA